MNCRNDQSQPGCLQLIHGLPHIRKPRMCGAPTPVYPRRYTQRRGQAQGYSTGDRNGPGGPPFPDESLIWWCPTDPLTFGGGCAVVVRDRPVGVLPAGATSSIPGSHAGTSVRIDRRLRNLLRPLVDFSILHDEVHL